MTLLHDDAIDGQWARGLVVVLPFKRRCGASRMGTWQMIPQTSNYDNLGLIDKQEPG